MNWFHLFTVILLIAQIGGWISISWWLVFAPSIFAVVVGLLFVSTVAIVAMFKLK